MKTEQPVPDYVKRGLNAASGPLSSDRLYIKCQKTQAWLCKNLGLATDDNRASVAGYDLDFCWRPQR